MIGSVLRGVSDALSFHSTFIYFYLSRTLVERTLQCFALNGVIFLGSIALVNYMLLPLVHALLYYDVDLLEPPLSYLINFMYDFMSLSFNILWLLPIYVVSFLLNGDWYQEIAEHANKAKQAKAGGECTPVHRMSFQKNLAHELYRTFLVVGLVIQNMLLWRVSRVPFIGPVFGLIGLLSLSWICAFYSFEYTWAIQGWPVEKKVRVFETNYAYFFGFGLPIALITAFFPFFVSNGLFCLVFPLFIILATAADIPPPPPSSIFPERIRIFSIIEWLTSKTLNGVDQMIKS